MNKSIKPVVLLVLDGWGVAAESDANLISKAKTANFDKLVSSYPSMNLLASGDAVGLRKEKPVDCAFGHLNIGTGQVPYKIDALINKLLADGSFFNNPIFLQAIEHVNKRKSSLHLVGLLSNADEHSSLEHLFGLLELCSQQEVEKVFLHLFLDGIDTPVNSGLDLIKQLQEKIDEFKVGKIATLCGRDLAMDRYGNWHNTEVVYRLLINNQSEHTFEYAESALESFYDLKKQDYEISPVVITENDIPVTQIIDEDAVICFNYRHDGMKQLTNAFLNPDFNKFKVKDFQDLFFSGFVLYDNYDMHVAFETKDKWLSLAQILSEQGITQLHLADSTKFSEVTYFFNGQDSKLHTDEKRIIVPQTEKQILNPKAAIRNKDFVKVLTEQILSDKFDFIVSNLSLAYNQAGQVNLKNTIKAIEITDKILGEIVEVVLSKQGVCVICSDHGFLEQAYDVSEDKINTQHSTNPVPLIIAGAEFEGKTTEFANTIGSDLSISKPVGVLSDVAPTILKILNIDKPSDMTGSALI